MGEARHFHSPCLGLKIGKGSPIFQKKNRKMNQQPTVNDILAVLFCGTRNKRTLVGLQLNYLLSWHAAEQCWLTEVDVDNDEICDVEREDDNYTEKHCIKRNLPMEKAGATRKQNKYGLDIINVVNINLISLWVKNANNLENHQLKHSAR